MAFDLVERRGKARMAPLSNHTERIAEFIFQ